MRWLTLSQDRAQQLRHFRRRIWILIALCFAGRGAEAALNLGLIASAEPAVAQAQVNCPTGHGSPS